MLAVSFTLATARDLAYLVAIAGFILALKGLSSPRTPGRATWSVRRRPPSPSP